MAKFENGVPGYVEGTATVKVFFPIDATGKAHMNCRQCYFYKCNTYRCMLNKPVVEEQIKVINHRISDLEDDMKNHHH